MFFLSTRQQIHGSAAIRILIERIRKHSGRYFFSLPFGVFFFLIVTRRRISPFLNGSGSISGPDLIPDNFKKLSNDFVRLAH